MPKISVIIPTYNREDFISETIQSVLDQTYKDFEIIVVDDGSKDNTKSFLEKFGSKIKLIEQKNQERAASRNNGVKASCGEYLAFVDSDDVWISNKLEKQLEILENNKETILTYGKSFRINQASKPLKVAQRQLAGYSGNVFEKLLFRNFIVSATPMVRREYFERTSGFETKYVPYEDWELWVRLSLLGKFFFVNKPLAYYRIHPEQSLKTTTAQKIEEVTTLLLEDSFRLKSIPENIKRKSLGLANLRFCYWYLRSYEIKTANEKIKKAMEYYPNFLFDPRWYGLNVLCHFPSLKDKWLFDLEQYH